MRHGSVSVAKNRNSGLRFNIFKLLNPLADDDDEQVEETTEDGEKYVIVASRRAPSLILLRKPRFFPYELLAPLPKDKSGQSCGLPVPMLDREVVMFNKLKDIKALFPDDDLMATKLLNDIMLLIINNNRYALSFSVLSFLPFFLSFPRSCLMLRSTFTEFYEVLTETQDLGHVEKTQIRAEFEKREAALLTSVQKKLDDVHVTYSKELRFLKDERCAIWSYF
jgi:hypothetical protein